MRFRAGYRGNGVDLAIDGTHRIIGCTLLEGFDVCHLYGRSQGCALREQGGVADVFCNGG